MRSSPVRVLLVDDDQLMRAGLRSVISSDEHSEVVGEASDGRIAVQRVRALAPDLVLMDVRMPDLDGIAATREVLAACPEVKVVILTTFEHDKYIFDAINAGASGFLLKRTVPRSCSQRSTPSPPATRFCPHRSPGRCSSASPASPPPGTFQTIGSESSRLASERSSSSSHVDSPTTRSP
jgi:DNA-binding NarL/FixJ family response regulator